jgi:hypothetical protein
MESHTLSIPQLIEKFKERRTTHPELASLWQHYLVIRQKRYDELVKQAEILLENMETCDDVSVEVIALLFIMQRQISNTT